MITSLSGLPQRQARLRMSQEQGLSYLNTPLQVYPEDTKAATTAALLNPAHRLLNTGGAPIVHTPAMVNTGALVSGGATLVNSGTLINAGILVNSGALVQDPATGALYLQGGTTQVV